MAKNKKKSTDKGASEKETKPKTALKEKVASEKKTDNPIIGIGMPVDEETMKKMKEEAEKPDNKK